MGAQPLKKTTGKVQPKKETVRISLPPKPSAAPTIKLPTLPPGGPTGAPSAASRPSAAAPRIATPPAAAPRAAAAPAAPRPAARPAAAATVGTLDTILAVAAMVTGLIAVGTTVWMMMMLNNIINNNS